MIGPALALLLAYLALVRVRRYRIRELNERTPQPLSLEDARAVIGRIACREGPWSVARPDEPADGQAVDEEPQLRAVQDLCAP